MKNINQVLVTIIEANRLACARNPHHQRLGLLLLDNVIEIQLRKRAEISMMFDETTWYSGVRKYDRKRRQKVARYHGEPLALAVEEDFITTQNQQLLTYGHRLRNHLYHEGREEDDTDLELGLSPLFRFVAKYFPEWRGDGMLMSIPSEKVIQFTDAMSDESGQAPLKFGFEQHDPEAIFADTVGFSKSEHWQSILDRVITYDFNKDVRPLIAKRIQSLIDQLQRNIEFLTESDDNDFNGVLEHRFAIMTPWFFENQRKGNSMNDPRIAVNIYLAVIKHEERLLDIADPTERANEFAAIVNAHDFKKDVLSAVDFAGYQALIGEVPSKSEAEGIAHFLDVESTLRPIFDAVEECAMDLDGYTQHMIDVIRGK